jgi:60 kDa SS-A/Ro ribonucleoprotein
MANPKTGKNPLLTRSATDDMNTRLYTQAGTVRRNSIVGLSALAQIEAAEKLLHMEGSSRTVVAEAVKLITDHRLTHEAIPSHLRKSPEIWEALLNDMPVTAMVRNLGAMTANGLLTPMSASQKKIVNALGNAEQIERSRAHPMQFLIAARQYGMGHGNRGNLSWSPNQKVMDALDGAFYASFGNVPVTGGNILVAVDTSGSMSGSWSHRSIMGIEGWTPVMAAGAMALVTLATEPNSHLIGFDTSYHEIGFTAKNRIDTIVDRLSRHRGGGTNTNLPVQYAWDKKLDVDAIVSYTDDETWAGQARFASYYRTMGGGHVTEWVTKYADRYGPFKFLNCAMIATGTSDVDSKNPMMFELNGMDANTPRIISEYVQGNL